MGEKFVLDRSRILQGCFTTRYGGFSLVCRAVSRCAARADSETVPGEVLVGFQPAASTRASTLLQEVGDISGPQLLPNVYHLRLKPGLAVSDAVAQLRRRSDVR